MITNKGRNILAKYLIGQAPSYASFIALGCGPKPLLVSESQGDYSDLNNLEFEVLRVPISSRGYVYDDAGNANIVFSAELPTEQRYEFTEIGVFSAKSNPVVGSSGSRMIYTFSESENWEYHDEIAAGSIVTYAQPLYNDEVGGEGESNSIAVADIAFRATSDNALFAGSPDRIDRHERPRFLDKALFVRGDMSRIESVAGVIQLDTSLPQNTRHIHYTGALATPDLTKNSSEDELRLAFSLVNKADNQGVSVDSVKIILEFANTDGVSPDNFARLSVDLDSSTTDFTKNRYFVIRSRLEDLQKSTGFAWSNVNLVKAYVSVYEADNENIVQSASGNGELVTFEILGQHSLAEGEGFSVRGVDSSTLNPEPPPDRLTTSVYNQDYVVSSISYDTETNITTITASGAAQDQYDGGGTLWWSNSLSLNYYVALDGLLFENTTASSPLYGMSGYSVLRNDQGLPVIKESNSANLVEFRFGLDVQ